MNKLILLVPLVLAGCARSYESYDIKVMSDYELCSTYKRHIRNKVTKQLLQNEVNHRARLKGEEWRESCTMFSRNKVKMTASTAL